LAPDREPSLNLGFGQREELLRAGDAAQVEAADRAQRPGDAGGELARGQAFPERV